MASRFYQLEYPGDKTPVYLEDLGNILNISGMLLQGKGASVLVLSPNAETSTMDGFGLKNLVTIQPTLEEWGAILRQSDDPVILERDSEYNIKAVHRKSRYAVSGAVQQQVWVRDGLQCLYCGRKMGDVQITVDHFVPLDLGGENNQGNYITACRQCQKDKGNREPEEWCQEKGYDYMGLKAYLEGKASKHFIGHLI